MSVPLSLLTTSGISNLENIIFIFRITSIDVVLYRCSVSKYLLFSFSELLILMLYYKYVQFPNICYDSPPLTGNSDHSNEKDLFKLSEMSIQLYHLLSLLFFFLFALIFDANVAQLYHIFYFSIHKWTEH